MATELKKSDKECAEILKKKLLNLSKVPSSLIDIFSNYEKPRNLDYSFEVFLRGNGNIYFDALAHITTDEEKNKLNDFFLSQKTTDPESIFFIPPKDFESDISNQHFNNAKLLRKHLIQSYLTLHAFPALRDKAFDLYHTTPGYFYSNCNSFKHYELLSKSMNISTSNWDKSKTTLISQKITTLYKFLHTLKKCPEYLTDGIRNVSYTPSTQEFKEAEKKGKKLILEWAKTEILEKEFHNSYIINSTVSALLANYTEKELTENGFPKIDWNSDIQITEIGLSNIGERVTHKVANHFYNVSKQKKASNLNKNYILQPRDWKHLYKFDGTSSMATDSAKNKIKTIVSNTLKKMGTNIQTPEGDWGDSLLFINRVKEEYEQLPIHKDSDYLLFALETLDSNVVDIFEIREKDGIKYSLFTNAFLLEYKSHTSSVKFNTCLDKYYQEAPQDNISIIADFYEEKSYYLAKKAIETLTSSGINFKTHLPLLEFIVSVREPSEKMVNNILKSFDENERWKIIEKRAKADTAFSQKIESILILKDNLQMRKNYFDINRNMDKNLPEHDTYEDNNPRFKL